MGKTKTPKIETRLRTVAERGVTLRWERYEAYGPDHPYVKTGIVTKKINGKKRPAKGAVAEAGEVFVTLDLLEDLEGGVSFLDGKTEAALIQIGWVKRGWDSGGRSAWEATPELGKWLTEQVYQR